MKHKTITKELALHELKRFITDGPTNIVYIDKDEKKHISWRESKINKDLIMKTDFSTKNITGVMYEFLKSNSHLVYDESSEYIYSGFIY